MTLLARPHFTAPRQQCALTGAGDSQPSLRPRWTVWAPRPRKRAASQRCHSGRQQPVVTGTVACQVSGTVT